MIKEVKSYSLICDNCGETFVENYCNYSVWIDIDMAIEYAEDRAWIEHEDKHYCPDCYKVDINDKITIKESEVNNEQ